MSKLMLSVVLLLCMAVAGSFAQDEAKPPSDRPAAADRDRPRDAPPRPSARRSRPPVDRPPARERDVPPRERLVLQLKNAPAMDVAKTIQAVLVGEQKPPRGRPPHPLDPSGPVIVAEPVSNSLVVSATADEAVVITALAKKLDRPRPMVTVEVVIAEVKTDDAESIAAIESADDDVAGKIAALEKSEHLKIIARAKLTTLDNQPAFLQIGERVPTVRDIRGQQTEPVARLEYLNTGLIVGLTPRIDSDGRVTMEIDVEKSELGPAEESIPLEILGSGKVVRVPRVRTTNVQTTISAKDGQTVLLGCLTVGSSSTLISLTPRVHD